MPNIGPLELAIVAIIALVIFGPKKLPELGSSLGRGMREFKSSLTGDDDGPDKALQVESHLEDDDAAAEDQGSTPVAEAAAEAREQTAVPAGRA